MTRVPGIMVAVAAGLAASSVQAKDRHLDNATERPVELAWHYAKCIVDTKPRKARRLFEVRPFSKLAARRLNDVSRPECLARIAGSSVLRMPNMSIRGALAEHLLANDFDGIFGEPRAKLPKLFDPVDDREIKEISPQELGALLLIEFAQCVVIRNPAGVSALFETVPTSEEETSAFQQLQPDLSACLTQDAHLEFSRSNLRGYLAEAAYRLSVDRASPDVREAA